MARVRREPYSVLGPRKKWQTECPSSLQYSSKACLFSSLVKKYSVKEQGLLLHNVVREFQDAVSMLLAI